MDHHQQLESTIQGLTSTLSEGLKQLSGVIGNLNSTIKKSSNEASQLQKSLNHATWALAAVSTVLAIQAVLSIFLIFAGPE